VVRVRNVGMVLATAVTGLVRDLGGCADRDKPRVGLSGRARLGPPAGGVSSIQTVESCLLGGVSSAHNGSFGEGDVDGEGDT
jgi:hypothetical protein